VIVEEYFQLVIKAKVQILSELKKLKHVI